jgi:hypothetical protein
MLFLLVNVWPYQDGAVVAFVGVLPARYLVPARYVNIFNLSQVYISLQWKYRSLQILIVNLIISPEINFFLNLLFSTALTKKIIY